MNEFRAEIECLKVEDRQSEHDRIHASNIQMGIDKYSTLRKVLFPNSFQFFFQPYQPLANILAFMASRQIVKREKFY